MDTQYKIIGGDGCEYGPATLEELRGWIRDGRVAASTPVWRSDLAKWSKAANFEELSAELQPLPQVIAVPLAEVSSEAPTGFWARLAATFVDWMLFTVLFSLVWEIVARLFSVETPPPPPQFSPGMDLQAFQAQVNQYLLKVVPIMIPFFILKTFFHAVYEITFNGKFGATPGKMAIGARIVRLDDTPIGYRVALFRWLAKFVSDFTFGAGYLFIAFRSDKRALHDLMVGTKVVYKK